MFDHLLKEAVLRHFVLAHSKKGAPVTKAAVAEMIIANLDHFDRSHRFPRPNGFSAPVCLFFRLPTVENCRLLQSDRDGRIAALYLFFDKLP